MRLFLLKSAWGPIYRSFYIFFGKRLLTGTVPVNNSLLTGTVPVNNSLFHLGFGLIGSGLIGKNK